MIRIVLFALSLLVGVNLRALASVPAEPNVIIVKLKAAYRHPEGPSVLAAEDASWQSLQVLAATRLFPNHRPPAVPRSAFPPADLSLIYKVRYAANLTPDVAAQRIGGLPWVAYAEPNYYHETFFVPVDPDLAEQWYLSNIDAFDAWDITRGDSSVVIGIVDSGVDWEHPDLAANVATNPQDPIDGIDNDNDGFVDNFRGWDFGGDTYQAEDQDNNPDVTANNAHGTMVAGLVGASTNNEIGIASVGFRCRILPVKCAADNDTRGNGVGLITHGYAGLVYAADHGASIINCSWGSTFPSRLGRDAVTYAAVNQNCLVVAAAGNANNTTKYYPASYPYVLSVASTTPQDTKAGFSTYNNSVDLSAPGVNIYTTNWNDGYRTDQGTSLSAPLVAAAAGLVKSVYPQYSGLQLGEQLRTTATPIDALNPDYVGALGRGRLNLVQALSLALPSVRTISIQASDHDDNNLGGGDTLSIVAVFYNYLQTTSSGLTAALSSGDPYATVLDGSASLGIIPTGQSVSNDGTPFRVVVSPDAPDNWELSFRIQYQDGSYLDEERFVVPVNNPYINIRPNRLATTVTSQGRLGYQNFFDRDGLGLRFDNESLLTEMGLMLSTDPAYVSDAVRDSSGFGYDQDFAALENVRRLPAPIGISALPTAYLRGVFADTLASNISHVTHEAIAWDEAGHDKYILLRFTFHNDGTTPLTNLHAGLYADWLLSASDRTHWSAPLRLGYVAAPDGARYAGVQVLTPEVPVHGYGLSYQQMVGEITLADGFTNAEKFATLSGGTQHAAGATGDVAQVVAAGPFSVAVGDSVSVSFAVHATESLSDLQASAAAARTRFNQVTSEPTATSRLRWQVYPNPTHGTLRVTAPTVVGISVYDLTGRLCLRTAPALRHNLDLSGLAPGQYLVVGEGSTTVQRTLINVIR